MARQHIQGEEWCNSGTKTDPGDTKQDLGYIAEKPPFQTENWKANRADQMLAHIEEYGMPVWDALTTYNITSYALGSDGIIYKSLQNTNLNNNPVPSSPSWWIKAFIDSTTTETITGTKTFNALKLGGNQDANNNKIVLLAAPTSNQDAANKAYVDSQFSPNPITGSSDSPAALTLGNNSVIKVGEDTLGGNSNSNFAHGLSKCFKVFLQIENASTSLDRWSLKIGTIDDTNFQVYNTQSDGVAFSWLAFGIA